jgi:hypothetical protein
LDRSASKPLGSKENTAPKRTFLSSTPATGTGRSAYHRTLLTWTAKQRDLLNWEARPSFKFLQSRTPLNPTGGMCFSFKHLQTGTYRTSRIWRARSATSSRKETTSTLPLRPFFKVPMGQFNGSFSWDLRCITTLLVVLWLLFVSFAPGTWLNHHPKAHINSIGSIWSHDAS